MDAKKTDFKSRLSWEKWSEWERDALLFIKLALCFAVDFECAVYLDINTALNHKVFFFFNLVFQVARNVFFSLSSFKTWTTWVINL